MTEFGNSLYLMRETEQIGLPFFEVFCEDQEVPSIENEIKSGDSIALDILPALSPIISFLID